MASYVFSSGISKFKQKSVGLSGLFSYKFRESWKQHHISILSCSTTAHLDFACYVRTPSTSTFGILPLVISSKPSDIKCRQMITHRSTPCQTYCWQGSSQGCFLEVSGCSSQFHNSLKSFLWRSLQVCNWEQMRRPMRASMVMSTLVEGKAWRAGKWNGEAGGMW